MSEKRKPSFTILHRYSGKKKSSKIELFYADLWKDGQKRLMGTYRYRIRVDGCWYIDTKNNNKRYFTWYEFRDLLWRSLEQP